MADEFMRAVATIGAEDRELRAVLYESEKQVKASTTRMQGDFNKVSTTMQSTGTQGANLGQIFGGVGAQASAMGGAVGSAGGAIAGLGSAFASMGTALFGLPGLIMAAVAALGLIAAAIFKAREETRQYNADLKEMSEGIADSMGAATKSVAALSAELAGPASKLMYDHRVALEEITKQQDDLLRQANKSGLSMETYDQIYAAHAALGEKRKLLSEKLNRALGAIHQKGVDDWLKREEAKLSKLLAMEKRARDTIQGWYATAKGMWDKSPAGKVSAFIASDTAAASERDAIRKLLPSLNLSAEMLAKIGIAFGLNGTKIAEAATVAAAGPRGTGVSANAYAFGHAAMGGGGFGGSVTETKATETAKNTARTAVASERQLAHLERMARGAG